MTSDVCKGCKAPIVWRRLNNKWHPCEPARRTIVVDEDGGKLASGHESHYAHCPNASEFRKPRGNRNG